MCGINQNKYSGLKCCVGVKCKYNNNVEEYAYKCILMCSMINTHTMFRLVSLILSEVPKSCPMNTNAHRLPLYVRLHTPSEYVSAEFLRVHLPAV